MDYMGSPLLLTPYQKEFLAWARNRDTIALFAPAGSGKSLPALLWALQGTGAGQVAVVCPNKVIPTWQEETKRLDCKKEVLIIPYSKFSVGVGVQGNYKAIIADESTYLKNPDAHRTRMMFKFAGQSTRRCILSALPTPQGLHEIFSQYKFLDLGRRFGSSYYAFLSRYFYRPWKWAPWEPTEWGKEKILEVISETAYIVREDQVATLPPQGHKIEVFDLPLLARQYYNNLETEYATKLKSGEKIELKYTIEVVQKLLQSCSGFLYGGPERKIERFECPKERRLLEILQRRKGPAIVWCNYKATQERVRSILKDIPTAEVLSYSMHAHGINRPSVTTVIYYEPCFSVERKHQASKRHRRLTTQMSSMSYYFCMQDSIEKTVVRAVMKKEKFSLKVLQDAFHGRLL